jgi:hypothetical protein
MEKSINKKWKESGSTLTFKDWLDRENKKKESGDSNFLPFDSVLQTQAQITDSIRQNIQNSEDLAAVNYKEDKSKVLGLDKATFLFSAFLVIGSISYFFYKRAKNKK